MQQCTVGSNPTLSAIPFPDLHSQEVKRRFDSVCDEEREQNSNTAPFPLSLVMEVKLFVASVMSESIDKSISGLFDVVASAVDVNAIPLNVSVPDVTAINEHPLLI